MWGLFSMFQRGRSPVFLQGVVILQLPAHLWLLGHAGSHSVTTATELQNRSTFHFLFS